MGKIAESRYTISEMSSLLGVTTHMLRHYEKMGIISPEVDKTNGYRYYTIIDTRRFNISRIYLSMGIPLEECSLIMDKMTGPEIEKLFEKRLIKLKQERARLEIAERELQSVIDILPVLDSDVGKIYIKNFNPLWRLNISDKEIANNSSDIEAEKQQWLDLMPRVSWFSKIPHEELTKFSEGVINYSYGLMITETDAKRLGLKRTANVEVVPGGDYASLIHVKSDRGPWTWEDIAPITEYLKARGLNYFGDGFSYIIHSTTKDGKQINYHELLVKIIG